MQEDTFTARQRRRNGEGNLYSRHETPSLLPSSKCVSVGRHAYTWHRCAGRFETLCRFFIEISIYLHIDSAYEFRHLLSWKAGEIAQIRVTKIETVRDVRELFWRFILYVAKKYKSWTLSHRCIWLRFIGECFSSHRSTIIVGSTRCTD